MTIKSIEKQEVWNKFIPDAQPNTFLHSWQWGEFQRAMGERIWRLGVYDGDTLYAVALVIKVQARRGSFLFCPHGPILNIEIFKYDKIKICLGILTRSLRTLAKEEGCSFVRFSPLMIKTPEQEGIWPELGFREAPTHMHPELAWILDITSTEEKLLAQMRKTTRYSIRKAEKDGVTIEMSANQHDIEHFLRVYKTTVGRQHFVPFSKKYLETELQIFNTNEKNAVLFFGKYRGEIISTALIIFQSWSAFYHHGASNPKYTNVPASQLVQWHAILEAKRRGCSRYNFWGIAPENRPDHPWAGLSLFKKGFGGYAEEYVHAKDLIVSPAYWLNFAVEYLRRIKRHL